MLLTQVAFPRQEKLSGPDKALIIFNGLFIGLGIFANLAFEVIGLDLYVVALLALIAVALLIRRGAQPMFVYYTTAYGFGLLGTALYKMFIA
jgi:type IV secretory pathway TrbD component